MRGNQILMQPDYKLFVLLFAFTLTGVRMVERLFNNLRFLDGQQVEPLMRWKVPGYLTSALNLPPAKPSFFDSDQTRSIATSFLTKYGSLSIC